MADPIDEFFMPSSQEAPRGHFHRSICLNDSPDVSWKEVHYLAPDLPKGWFELTRLTPSDRTGFIHDFWIATLPFHPRLNPFIDTFFSETDDIKVFVTQKMPNDPYQSQIVYQQASKNRFFRGSPPAKEDALIELHAHADEFILPEDFVAFYKIHNGFSKGADTGIFPIHLLETFYSNFREIVESQNRPILASDESIVDPSSLIPFYESFNHPCYQCFYKDWYPSAEMGNLYYSGLTHTITAHAKSKPCPEDMSFPSFSDWLIFYLEGID